MKKMFLGLLVGGLLLALTAGPALAASVTVQVESPTQVLGPVAVQTPASIAKDGTNTCDGATVAGAVEAATAGDWTGTFMTYGGKGNYTIDSVRGEAHAFGSGAFWSFYVNDQFQNEGSCLTPLHDGDHVLLYAADDEFIAGIGGYDVPLVLTAPAAIAPGAPFTVKVQIATLTWNADYSVGTTHLDPAPGATVTAGAVTATTGADGTATLTLPSAGPSTLVATLGNHAPDRTQRCVTTGSDGSCGTTAPGSSTTTAPAVPPCQTTGDDGRCGSPDKRAAYGFVTSVKEQQRFVKGKGPRELVGRVDDEPSGIKDIRLRLTRNDRGRCATYDGKAERFVAMKRCGAIRGRWFSVGSLADWRYLLPSKLPRGRYVLDVRVTDKVGNQDATLARGRNRVVFFVA